MIVAPWGNFASSAKSPRSQRSRFRRRVRRQDRRGIEVLEFILVMPVLIIALIAGIQFATVLVVDNTIQAAAFEAARVAAGDYCDDDDVTNAVDDFLAVHGISLGPGVRLVLQDSTGITGSFGDATLTSDHLGSLPDAGTVQSVLIVETDQTPIPNLLANYCVDFSGKQYEACAVSILPQCCRGSG